MLIRKADSPVERLNGWSWDYKQLLSIRDALRNTDFCVDIEGLDALFTYMEENNIIFMPDPSKYIA